MIDDKAQEFANKSAAEIGRSTMFVSMVMGKYLTDPGCMMQLGMAVAMGKPIYMLVEEGQSISEPLRRSAQMVEYFKKGDQGDMERATKKLADAARQALGAQ